MAITSASSLDEIAAAYVNNAGYDLSGGSVAMAEEFVIACRALQVRRPTSVSVDGNPVSFDYRAIPDQMNRALQWISANKTQANGSSSTAKIYNMSGVRRRW